MVLVRVMVDSSFVVRKYIEMKSNTIERESRGMAMGPHDKPMEPSAARRPLIIYLFPYQNDINISRPDVPVMIMEVEIKYLLLYDHKYKYREISRSNF